jgi:hypothetical protein
MTGNRKLIQQLAIAPGVARGTFEVAQQVMHRAQQIDPQGEFEVVASLENVNGMTRRSFDVVNTAPDAGKVEFGDPGAGTSGRSGLRPLGRAAKAFGG